MKRRNRNQNPQLPQRSWTYRLIKRMRGHIDRIIAGFSIVPNDSVIDNAYFPWAKTLEDNWQTIRREAEALLSHLDEIPSLRLISPDHRRIAQSDLWKSFFLYGYGYKAEENCVRCPQTATLVEQIPDLNSAFFSILLPGTHIASHRGPTKGLLTCHLALMVPEGCRMQVDKNVLRWQEGKCLIWDDTYRHEVWHEGDSPRIILLVQIKRPLRAPGKQLANLFLAGIKRSPFVQEGRRNVALWEQAMNAHDRFER